jgi:nucleoside-diphosphate-sugar epimerase
MEIGDCMMNVILIGGSGTAGRSILAWLSSDLSVLAVSRTRPADPLPSHVRWKAVDLERRDSIRSALQNEPVDILIYAAAGQPIVSKYKPVNVAALRRLAQRVGRKPRHQPSDYHKAALITQTYDPGHRNFALFNNVIEVLQERPVPLQHVILLTGGMSYGIQSGPVFDPHWTGLLTEESPRHLGPNWYYDMEDYAAYLRHAYCPVTLLRPSYILYEGGFVRQNLAHSIGLYLECQRQLGAKAVFPGGEENYHCSWSFTPSSLIGRQVDWIIHRRDSWGEVFNSVADQPLTWSTLWPRLAAAYGLEVEVPRLPVSVGLQVREHLSDYPLLVAHGYDTDYFTPLDFIDIAMVCYWNMVYSMEKATRLGFDANADIYRPFALEQQRLNDWRRTLAPVAAFHTASRKH